MEKAGEEECVRQLKGVPNNFPTERSPGFASQLEKPIAQKLPGPEALHLEG